MAKDDDKKITPEDKVNQELASSGIGTVQFQPIETEMEKSYECDRGSCAT